MSRHSFATSPVSESEQRKFINPTQGYVGANVFGPDGKPTAIAVEPGGEVWLTPAEERMTAEAPRSADDNPFIKEWEEAVDWDPATGEPTSTVKRQGTLVLADEPARPVASDRYIPPAEAAAPAAEEGTESEPEEITGAPELEPQPPVEGQPSEGEVLGTPEAPEANDEALAAREPTAEQPTRPRARSGAIPS